MSILDSTLEFADAVSIAASAGTANIGNVIDSSVVRNIGRGKQVYLGITVDTGIVAAGAGTLQLRLVADTSSTVSTSAPAEVLANSPIYATATSAAGSQKAGGVLWSVALPVEDGQAHARYLAVQAIIGSQTISAGKINAFLTLDPITAWEAVPVATY